MSGRTQDLTVRAVYDADLQSIALSNLAIFDYLVRPADFQQLGGNPNLDTVYATVRDGVTPTAGATTARAIADYPTWNCSAATT
jgi:putative ABC transport system permease protein